MRRSRRRRSQPMQVGEMVGGVLGDLGLEGAARAFQIAERWEEALGPEIARHSQPVALRDGTLEVWVTSSVWCQQLQLQSPELLAALSAVLLGLTACMPQGGAEGGESGGLGGGMIFRWAGRPGRRHDFIGPGAARGGVMILFRN